MKIQTRRQGDITVVDLEGHLDFEATRVFQETAWDLLQDARSSQVIFNLAKLRFVGSSGISQFIKAVKKLNTAPAKPKLCNLSSEFTKMFRALQTARNPFQIFDDESQAMASFTTIEQLLEKPRRRKTIAN